MTTTDETKTAPKKPAKRAKKSAAKGAQLHALPPPPPRPESPIGELSAALAVIVDQLRDQSIAQSALAAASLEAQKQSNGLVYTVRAQALARMFYAAIDAAHADHQHRAEFLRVLADEIDSSDPGRKFHVKQHELRDLLDEFTFLRMSRYREPQGSDPELPSLDAPAADEPTQGLPPDETV
jgi:hypothetical protein